MTRIISAVFPGGFEAEEAVRRLRAAGIPDASISVVAQQTSVSSPDPVVEIVETDAPGAGVTRGLGMGAGLGALFGIAAAVIPGVGPFIAAGAIANVIGMAGAGAVAGALVGGVAGGLAESLEGYGVERAEAVYYAEQVHLGGVFVGVAVSDSNATEPLIRDILAQTGGRSAV